MVYQHLPHQSGQPHHGMPADPGWPAGAQSSHHHSGQEPSAPLAKGNRRFRPGAIGLIARRLVRAFRTHG
jgi:hypothetical protein